jgi:DNA-binding transcriptional LysR family regulator
MTIHQLRILVSVAQSRSLRAASKRLDLAQPSVSKQLVALEESVGARLFVRLPNGMVLTGAGRVLLRHAQSVLREVNEAEAGLREFATGRGPIVHVAGLHSVIKALLPGALIRCSTSSRLEVDIQEVLATPGDVIEMLYSGQVHIGLIAADSVAQVSIGFRQVPILEDPYVFAVPNSIDLGAITDINSAPSDVVRVLNSCIMFRFGTLHRLRVQEWYQRALPSHRIVAHCRSYETALELVRLGFGVCLVPALPAFSARGRLAGINLFATDYSSRRTVAILADRYLHLTPYKQLVEALQMVGRDVLLQPILPMPRLIQSALSRPHIRLKAGSNCHNQTLIE